MNDPDEIIILSPDEEDEAEHRAQPSAEETSTSTRRWPLWLGAGFALGMVAASVGSWFLRPETEIFDPQPFEARLAAMETELQDLRSDVVALQNAPDPIIPEVNLSPLERRITELEARPTVDPLNEEIVARMEALQAEGFEIPEIPEFPDMDTLNTRIAELEAGVQALEARPVTLEAPPTPEPVIVDPDTLPRFPANALRQGADELSGSGFLRRTMSRHIRLKGDNNPHILIDRIEADLAAGRANAALSKFDQLPDSLQSLARGWRADMESALP